MKPPTPDTLYVTIDRTASELLWSLTQLTAQPLCPALRERTSEILKIVHCGLRHHLQELNSKPKNSQR